MSSQATGLLACAEREASHEESNQPVWGLLGRWVVVVKAQVATSTGCAAVVMVGWWAGGSVDDGAGCMLRQRLACRRTEGR